MRRLVLTLVPLFLFACDRETLAPDTEQAPAIPSLSANGQARIRVIPYNVVGVDLGSCGGFDILADWSAELRILEVFDQDGADTLRKETYDIIGQTTYYNSDLPNLLIRGGPGEGENVIYRFNQSYAIVTGLIWRVVLPGIGPIFLDAGAVKFDLATGAVTYAGGQHQYWEGDFGALCAALTP